MPSPSYVPVVRAATLTLGSSVAVATADQPITGSTAQVASTFLTLPVDAGSRYVLDCGLIFANTSAAATFTVGWTGPAGASLKWNDTGASLDYRATIGGTNTFTGSAADRMAFFRGALVVGPTAGALTLTFATSDIAATSTVRQDSWLSLVRVA